MRHRMRGRKLGRNPSHRKAMFRNMACSLIRSVRVDDDDPRKPRVPGRIVTTVAKAKELRPFVERLVTLARRSLEHEERAEQFGTSAVQNSDEWKSWRDSDQWQQWNQAIAPALALRRRAFALLRDNEAVDILFDELALRFEHRDGGYTRVVRLANVRLGDAGQQALIEFVGEDDRRDQAKAKRKAPVVADTAEPETPVEEPAAPGEAPRAEEETAAEPSEQPRAEALPEEASPETGETEAEAPEKPKE